MPIFYDNQQLTKSVKEFINKSVQDYYSRITEDCEFLKKKLRSKDALSDTTLSRAIQTLITDKEKLKKCMKDMEFNESLVNYISEERFISNSPVRGVIPDFHKILDEFSEGDEELKKKFHFWKLRTMVREQIAGQPPASSEDSSKEPK